MKTLLLIPGVAPAQGGDARHQPLSDVQALAAALNQSGPRRPGGTPQDADATGADLLDYRDVDTDRRPLVRGVRRVAGRDAALALLGFLRRGRYDVIFTGGETVGLPLALLLGLDRRRPGHVTTARGLAGGRIGFGLLRAHRQMDAILLHTQTQADNAEDRLGVPADRLRLVGIPVDDHFFRPAVDAPAPTAQVGVAGDAWRDDDALQTALAGLPGLSAGRITGDAEHRRQGCADAGFVAISLRDGDSPDGVGIVLEAMAMGKAVVVTRTAGLPDIITDGETGLCVSPGDAEGWQEAIRRLHSDDALRARLGRGARLWVERHAALSLWVGQVVTALEDCARPRVPSAEEARPASAIGALAA